MPRADACPIPHQVSHYLALSEPYSGGDLGDEAAAGLRAVLQGAEAVVGRQRARGGLRDALRHVNGRRLSRRAALALLQFPSHSHGPCNYDGAYQCSVAKRLYLMNLKDCKRVMCS